jgi:serine/threonine protein kinase/tetratricopeptide (TPR) repeat protein
MIRKQEFMEQIGHYKIVEKLGSGGMGAVFKAFDSVLEREVAIKVMHRHLLEDEKNDERFMREARAAARLVHPHVVTIHEVGKAECGRYIVMEYIQGLPLTKILDAEGALKPERAIKLIIQILDALRSAHAMGILHRDIKPDNLLVTVNDNVKILDFGIAKISTNQGLTFAGDILGTVEYMAPEQMLGELVDHRCDLYAAGVVLYQILTGRLPFVGESAVSIVFKKLNEEPAPPSYYNRDVRESLDQVVLKAIHGNGDERWSTAEAFSQALEALLKAGEIAPMAPQTGVLPLSPDLEVKAEEGVEFDKPNKLRAVFVGREKEFKKLANLLNQATRGSGQTVIIMGEAGVGKSSLATRLRNYAEHNQVWVLSGACLYQEGMDAYLPFIDALRGFFGTQSHGLPDEERQKLKDMVREKVPLLMEFTERFMTVVASPNPNESSAPSPNNSNLFEGIYLLISLLSNIRPLVLIIDDLQWADDSSLRLFHYLSREVAGNRVLLLGISRTDRYDLHHNGKPAMIVDMLARMRREGTCEQITLERLSRDECDYLIDESLISTMFPDEFYETLYRETKGNPFFVLEHLKLLRETGGILFEEGAWYENKGGFKLEVPNRVEDVFLRRLSGLTDEEREILQVAAVIGYKFDVSLVSQLLEISKIKLLKIMQRIEREAQILASTEKGFQFEHPILRDLLYNEIAPTLRQEYHLMVATELEKIHGHDLGHLVGETAQHFRRGGEHLKAVPLLYQAGLRAFELSAYREASLFFEEVMDSAELSGLPLPSPQAPSVDESTLYLKLGICYEEIGDWEQSLEAYNKLLALSEQNEQPQGQIDALRRMGRVHDKLGNWETALAAYERCLRIVHQHPLPNVLSRIYNSIGLIYFSKGDYDWALQYFNLTIQSVDSEAGEYDRAHVLTNIGIIANIRGDYSAALENYHQALKIYESKNERKGLARVYHNIGMTHSDCREWTKAVDAFEHCLKLADEVQDKQMCALTYLNMGKAYARQENISKARDYTEKALKRFKRMGDILSVAEAYHVFGIIHAARGDFAEAEKFLKESIRINLQKGFQDGLAEAFLSHGNLCRDHGQIACAREYYHKAAEAFEKLNMEAKTTEIKKLIEELSTCSSPEVKEVHVGYQSVQAQHHGANAHPT